MVKLKFVFVFLSHTACWGWSLACVLPTFLRAVSLLPTSRSSPLHERFILQPAQLSTEPGGVKHNQNNKGRTSYSMGKYVWLFIATYTSPVGLSWADSQAPTGLLLWDSRLENCLCCWLIRGFGEWFCWMKLQQTNTDESEKHEVQVCQEKKRKDWCVKRYWLILSSFLLNSCIFLHRNKLQ